MLIIGKVYFDFCRVLCSIVVPVPLIRKVSVFKQKCASIPIDKIRNSEMLFQTEHCR